MSLFRALPLEALHHILSYNRHFVVRNGKLIQINRLDLAPYAFLLNLPKIKVVEDDVSEVVLPIKNSNCFFCLLSIHYNASNGLELQKFARDYGVTYFLDYVTYTV
jgi:hypothetical protein